jgi:chromosome partitioning protein
MFCLALYNIKGGVGKTTTSVNLAYLAAKEGFRTLLCDFDPQGSSSFYFRVKPSEKFSRKKLLEGRESLEKNIKATDFKNLDLLPADISYRNLDIALHEMKKSKTRLKKILSAFNDMYDFVFLDCPPNITLLSENVIHAADKIIVPVIPTTLSIITYHKIIDFFEEKEIKKSKLLAFFSMVETKKNMHLRIIKEASEEAHFLKTRIPYSAVVEKMGEYRKPVLCFSPGSAASRAFLDLWHEIKQVVQPYK